MNHEELYYDFDRDAWIERPSIHARWGDRDLPPAHYAPAPGTWVHTPGKVRQVSSRAWPFVIAWTTGCLAGLWLGLGYVLPIAAGIQGAYLLFTAAPPRPSEEDRLLLENPDDQDACLVQATIRRNGKIVGTDRGAVWFEGGRLLFCGHHTSFAIGGEDVIPLNQWSRSQRERHDLLRLRGLSFSAELRFTLVPEPCGLYERERRFLERFHAFRTRPPKSRGPRQWPPFE